MYGPPSQPRLVPFEIPGAASISKFPSLADPLHVIGLLKSHPNVHAVLEEATQLPSARFRPRVPGSYTLLYFAFIASGEVDVQPWHQRSVNDSIWQICGFPPGGVSYATVQRRFADLERYEAAFEKALALLIRFIRKSIPEIGQWLHIDSTEAQTHSQLRHACPPGTCPTHTGAKQVSSVDARRLRQGEADDDEDVRTPEIERTTIKVRTPGRGIDRELVAYRLNGHLYTTADHDAGLRAYKTGAKTQRYWFGQYACEVVDHVTGIPVSTRLYPASQNEAAFYGDAITHAMDVTGIQPVAVAGDKGFSVSAVFEWNSRRGIGSVMPRRKRDKEAAQDHHDWDEDGIPSCPHCGGGTDFVAWVLRDGKAPLLRFQCALPETDACMRIQSISANKGWAQLLPISRTSDIYAELLVSHELFERAHHQMRARFNVGPDAHGIRPKRVGMPCQQLRATVALVILWLNVPLLLGLNNAPPLIESVKRIRRDKRREERNKRMSARRRANALVGGSFPSRRE